MKKKKPQRAQRHRVRGLGSREEPRNPASRGWGSRQKQRTLGSGGGVAVSSGTFYMSGGTISGNTSSGSDGGVCNTYGTFIMNNGTISGNTSSYNGGGVFVNNFSSSITMTGGTISGNTASGYGGGVYAERFSKSGTAGIIYGSNAPEEQANKVRDDSLGHAVYVSNNNKKRNTTARVTTAMDSYKDGPAGGWE